MALHPEAQKKAQAELDAVVGPGRMPEFSDWKSLVYVDALIKEVLRWHTVAPFGLAHSTTADDELNGYFIPAGTVLLPNIWLACSAFLPNDPDTEVTDDCYLGRACMTLRYTKILTCSAPNVSFATESSTRPSRTRSRSSSALDEGRWSGLRSGRSPSQREAGTRYSHARSQDLSRATLRRSRVIHQRSLGPPCVRHHTAARCRRPPYRPRLPHDAWLPLVRTFCLSRNGAGCVGFVNDTLSQLRRRRSVHYQASFGGGRRISYGACSNLEHLSNYGLKHTYVVYDLGECVTICMLLRNDVSQRPMT